MNRARRRLALPVIGLLALSGCEDERGEEGPPAAAEARTATATDAASTAAEAPTEVRSAPQVALDGKGIRLVAPSGSTRLIAFGAPREQIERAVGVSLGREPERGENRECGAGPMHVSDYGPLKLHFQSSKFVGWFLDGDAGLTTMDGIGPGTARAQVEQSRVVTPIIDSTLGAEFTFGTREQAEMGGFFDGQRKDSRVQSLFAGTTCFFR